MKKLQMYINGAFDSGFNGQYKSVLNPSTEEVIAEEPIGGKEAVDKAVAAAKAAQKAGNAYRRLSVGRIYAKLSRASVNVPMS